MGKPLRRVNPKVTSRVDRNYREFAAGEAWKYVRKLSPPWSVSERGRPPADPQLVAVCCLLSIACCWTYDQYASERADPRLCNLLGVGVLPSRSVVHRGMCKLSQKYLRRFNKILTGRLLRRDLRVVVDSTGVRLVTSSSWYDIRIGRRNSRKDNAKLHLAIDPRRNVILEYRITKWCKGDSPQLEFLLRTLREVGKVIGDSGYLSRKNCSLAVRKNGKPFFKLKSNTTARAKSSPAWKAMVRFAHKRKKLYDKIYHVRSLVESVISALKRKFGSTVRAVKRKTRNVTIALRIIAYNIKQVLYDQTARRLRVPYWIKTA